MTSSIVSCHFCSSIIKENSETDIYGSDHLKQPNTHAWIERKYYLSHKPGLVSELNGQSFGQACALAQPLLL